MHTSLQFTSFLALSLVLSAAAQAQGERQQLAPPALPAPPQVQAADRPAYPTIAGGPVTHVPAVDVSDDVPLPIPRVVRADEAGDVVLAPASGDPHFIGFAAGGYYPPADEVVDPALAALIATQVADGRPADVVYAFVMFSKRISAEREDALDAAGARVVGFHPHHSLRVALSVDALEAVAALPFVRWIGLPRTWQKVHPNLAHALEQGAPEAPLDVFVNVFDSDLCDASRSTPYGSAEVVSPLGPEPDAGDMRLPRRVQSNGWQQAALERVGLEVKSYHDGIRAFRARLTPAQLAALLALDHVQFVELDQPTQTAHDESQPFVHADLGRATWDGNTSGTTVVGVMDSGIENSHVDLNHIWGIGWNLSTSNFGPWDDVRTHGTHVAGTVFGNGDAREGRAGAAPDLGWSSSRRIFNVKLLNDFGSGIGVVYSDALDLIGSDAVVSGVTTPKPHVVNNSYGVPVSGGNSYFGTEATAREIDNHVYLGNQLMVFAAGNEGAGAGTIRLEATAKNALTVGSVTHYVSSLGAPGEVVTSSSRGPCADGRWKPNVAAPGSGIWSADADNLTGYDDKSGTSMAAPHVAGIAAQLCDHHAFLRYNPPTLSALLMATSISRNLYAFGSYSTSQPMLNQYGTGRVDAIRAHDGSSQNALGFWGWVQTGTGHTEIDFNINAGATRVTVVMNYTDLAASSGASQALIRDMDMYLDRFPFTGSGNTGDYFAHQSTVDNTEVRVLNNPAAGAWKIKVFPEYGNGFLHPKVGVAVIISYGDTTPDGSLTVVAGHPYRKPGEIAWVTAQVSNPSDTASAVYLESTATGNSLHKVETFLADGAVTELVDNETNGRDIMLGNIQHGDVRLARWHSSWASEGVKTFRVDLSSENMVSETGQVTVTVDGTSPGQASNFTSQTHTVGAHSCDGNIVVGWTPAVDALSGLDGYNFGWTTSPTTPLAAVKTMAPAVISYGTTLQPTTDPDGWYFHLRAVDRAGNWGSTAHYGPFFINEASVTSYCPANLNSSGNPAVFVTANEVCLAEEQLQFVVTGLPTNKFGYFLTSPNQAFVPFFNGSQGNLCLGAPIIRFAGNVLNSGASGIMAMNVDFDALPFGLDIGHGETHNFQLWFRDNNPGPVSNTSNGLEITFD